MLAIQRSLRAHLSIFPAPAAIRLLSSSRQSRETASVGTSSSTRVSQPPPTSPSQRTSSVDPLERLQRRRNLFEHLASLPDYGVGTRVRQYRWALKGLDVPRTEPLTGPPQAAGREPKETGHLCYYTITKVKMKPDLRGGKPFGKVWGRLTWRGKLLDARRDGHVIRDGLKYAWGSAH